MIVGAIRLFMLCALIGGCASAPQHVKLYEGEAIPTNEVATLRVGEGVKILKSGDRKLNLGDVGELLPGRYEIIIEGRWWDRSSKATNVLRGTAVITCAVGLYGPILLTPFAVACLPLLKPDKICDCHASIDVIAGKEYEVFIDWSGKSPMLHVSESTGNNVVFTTECVIRE